MIVMFVLARSVVVLLIGLGLLAVGGCAGASGSAATGRLSIVVAFYPYQFVAERVAGDRADVQNLTAPGAEPHDVELTGRQVAAVTDADLVIYEKTFQAAVDEAVKQSGTANALDTGTVVPLQAAAPDEHAEDEHAEDEHAEDEHAEDEHAGLDPHTWLDPINLAKVATAVAERLATADPQYATTYTANARTLTDELTRLDHDLAAGLESCQRTEFITTHAAFGYLARRYGLEQIGISGLGPDAEPSPARIAEVQQLAREHGVTTIFYETQVSPAVAESIANDLRLATDVLDPIEGLTEQSRGTDYLAVMRSNLAALRKANACR